MTRSYINLRDKHISFFYLTWRGFKKSLYDSVQVEIRETKTLWKVFESYICKWCLVYFRNKIWLYIHLRDKHACFFGVAWKEKKEKKLLWLSAGEKVFKSCLCQRCLVNFKNKTWHVLIFIIFKLSVPGKHYNWLNFLTELLKMCFSFSLGTRRH